jgi:hypothetical protein
MSMKISNDIIGNRTRDLRLLAQCLNQLRHRYIYIYIYTLQELNQSRKIRQHSRYHDRDSKWAPAHYKSEE